MAMTLLACGSSQSVLSTLPWSRSVYSPYGRTVRPHSRLLFNGQLAETQNAFYILGNGYRAYCPSLMRFTKPDHYSPFRSGGLNSYVYVQADPVNRADPNGAMFKPITRMLSESLPLPTRGWTYNVRPIAPEISVHDDLFKGYRRLNINAHGRPGSVKLGNIAADGDTLYEALLEKNVNFQDYRYIRLLSCCSAELHPFSGKPRIPQVLAERTGLAVKAFRGDVVIRNDVGDLSAARASGRTFRENPAGGYDIQGEIYVIKRRADVEYSPEWFYPISFYR